MSCTSEARRRRQRPHRSMSSKGTSHQHAPLALQIRRKLQPRRTQPPHDPRHPRRLLLLLLLLLVEGQPQPRLESIDIDLTPPPPSLRARLLVRRRGHSRSTTTRTPPTRLPPRARPLLDGFVIQSPLPTRLRRDARPVPRIGHSVCGVERRRSALCSPFPCLLGPHLGCGRSSPRPFVLAFTSRHF